MMDVLPTQFSLLPANETMKLVHMANACPRNKKAFAPSLFAMHITEFADYSSNSF
jgi:hypothetical protein